MKLRTVVGGLVTGILNGLLGAGGGMIAVPMLKKQLDTKTAHATSVCIILPICIISSINYLSQGRVTINDALPYILWGVIGAIIGTIALQRLRARVLRKLFALLMLWAGIRLLTA
ncbi:MAG TPA: sulfite exporter TauE/SafE family protein [Clostridiales bacterium]|nr:sulfite exporter TauE/SafE family protein [Clostridiales bacterium]